MPRLPDYQNQFVTLIAHNDNPALPIKQLRGSCNSTLVLTSTQHGTATAIANSLFDLIIIDIDLIGLGIISQAKSASCINCQTPVIALVNKDDDAQRKNLVAAGFDDCLTKPLTNDNLNEVVAQWRETDVLSSYVDSAQTLLDTFRNDKDIVLTLYSKIFEELPKLMDQVELALKTVDYDAAFHATHKINASAKICYMKSIEEMAMALESCLIQKKYEFVDGYFTMLQQSVSAFVDYREIILDYVNNA
jgi:CheY-like chemotaxis protein